MGCGGSVQSGNIQDVSADEHGSLDDDDVDVSLGGRWHYEESPGVWAVFSPEINAALLVAWYCGETKTEYSTSSDTFYVDMEALTQTSKTTGSQQRIGWAANLEDQEEQAEPVWIDCEGGIEKDILDAWAAGHEVVRYSADGYEYEVDFTRMLSTNLTTGQQYQISLESVDDDAGDGATSPVEVPPKEVEEWIECLDAATGKFYYHRGDQSTWVKPTGPNISIKAGHVHDGKEQPPPAASQQQDVWMEYVDTDTGKRYYGNGRKTTWDRPSGPNVVIHSATDMAASRSTEVPHHPNGGVSHAWTGSEQESPGRSAQKKWTFGPDRAPQPPRADPGGGENHGGGISTSHGAHAAGAEGFGAKPSAGTAAGMHFSKGGSTSKPQQGVSNTGIWAKGQGGGGGGGGSGARSSGGADQGVPAAKERPVYGQRATPGAAANTSPPEAAGPQAKPSPGGVPGGGAGRAAGKPRPKAKAFRTAAAGRAPKKWTLGPEKQDLPPPTGPGGAGWQQAGQPPPAGAPPAGPGGGASQQPSGPKLPPGITWPADPKAKKVVEALYKDMVKSAKAPIAERQKAYKAACLSWHPDKNPKHEKLATSVFQFLQSLKKWYLS